MAVQIQLRRDTAADWTSNNPTLAAGEFGWESDTNRFKIGTGSAAWNSLSYSDTLKTLGDIGVTGSEISAPSNADLELTTSGSGKVKISGAYTLPSSDGSANQVLQTNGSGVLSFGTVSVGDFSFNGSTIIAPSNADLTLDPSGTGSIKLNAGTDVTGALTTTTSLNIASDGATVTGIKDEDDMSSNSAVKLATQQSIKAFVESGTSTLTNKTLTNPTINAFTGTGNGSVTGVFTITNTSTDDALTITNSGDSSSTAGPVITLKRNSGSPEDADYLGQIKFKGENDNDQAVTYAKISGKISDASDGTEDGIIEIAHIKAGSNVITGRFKSDKYQLLNGTELEVAGALTASTSLNIAGDGATVTGIKDEDNFASNSATKLATQQSIKAYVDNEIANVSVGDLSFVGSTIASPTNADLTLNSSNGNVVIEGLRVSGTTLQTEDSSAGIQINGNLIPSQDGVFQLGSSSRRWQTLYVAAETIDLGGATISSDGTGQLAIAATGATLPSGSKVGEQALVLAGKTNNTSSRPVQLVGIFVSDGSTILTDAQILATTAALTLEFNGTVDDVPVYTEANQSFTLSSGASLASNQTGVTLFQF